MRVKDLSEWIQGFIDCKGKFSLVEIPEVSSRQKRLFKEQEIIPAEILDWIIPKVDDSQIQNDLKRFRLKRKEERTVKSLCALFNFKGLLQDVIDSLFEKMPGYLKGAVSEQLSTPLPIGVDPSRRSAKSVIYHVAYGNYQHPEKYRL